MNVEVRNEAHLDSTEGVAFYGRQGYGAGDYFYHRIFEEIDSLSETAGVYETHFGYHRKISSRHPFLIYNRIVATGVELSRSSTVGHVPRISMCCYNVVNLDELSIGPKVLVYAALTCVEITPRPSVNAVVRRLN